jgi:hypothetical protein
VVQLRYNPFRPNSIIAPGSFVGRIEEIQAVSSFLFQSKNANPQHFLVQGERGIGKSSLLFYLDILASGKIIGTKGEKFRFLSVQIDLGGCSTQVDIVRKVGRALKAALAGRDSLKRTAASVWNWVSSWEVLGVRYHKNQDEVDPEEISEELVQKLSELCSDAADEIDGILLLIDEADRPPSDAGLGEFLKLLTERLTRSDCNNVLIGLAALPTILAKLRASHESAPRLFHTFLLDPLEVDERKRVIQLGLRDAKAKNEVDVTISSEALDFLADLSEGYPHFLQQFAYSAFGADVDGVIDIEDVSRGAFADGGALAQLGDKFFNEMYHARISSEDYRRVLDAMADHADEWIPRRTIVAEATVSEAAVNNALQALKSKEIIQQDETRRGYYRLPTRSFAAWINAIRAAKAKGDVDRLPKI